MSQLDKANLVNVQGGNVEVSGEVSVTKVQADFKNIDFSNTDASPKTIFTPPSGAKLVVDDVIIAGINKNTNPIVVGVQVLKGGNWITLIASGSPNINVFNMSHAFNGEILLDDGDGVNPRIRAVKTGTSTSWQTSITVVGHIKE
jgi:hypothetical protein